MTPSAVFFEPLSGTFKLLAAGIVIAETYGQRVSNTRADGHTDSDTADASAVIWQVSGRTT